MIAPESFLDLVRRKEWYFNRERPSFFDSWRTASIVIGGYKVRVRYHTGFYGIYRAGPDNSREYEPLDTMEVAEYWVYSGEKSTHRIAHCSVTYNGAIKWWKRLPDSVYVKMRLTQ